MALLRSGLAAAVMAWALTACASGVSSLRDFVADGAAPKRGMAIAVLPFENLWAHPDGGQIVAQLIAT